MESPLLAKSALRLALLEGSGYGSELVARLARKTSSRLRLHAGNVYAALRTLEDSGQARSWQTDPLPERGGRKRRVYDLTPDGLALARQEEDLLRQLLERP